MTRLQPRPPTIRRIGIILGLLALIIFLLSVAVATVQPAQVPKPSVSCFIGRIVGVDTTRLQHAFLIQYMETVPPVNDSAWASPVMPYVLVCSRFPADGTSTKEPS